MKTINSILERVVFSVPEKTSKMIKEKYNKNIAPDDIHGLLRALKFISQTEEGKTDIILIHPDLYKIREFVIKMEDLKTKEEVDQIISQIKPVEQPKIMSADGNINPPLVSVAITVRDIKASLLGAGLVLLTAGVVIGLIKLTK